MVKVRFSAAIGSAVNGEAETTVAFEGKIGGLLAMLAEKYGEKFSSKLFKDGRLHKYVNLYINGEDINYAKGTETEVGESDTVYLAPAISGG